MQRQARIGFIGAGNFVSAHHLLTARDSDLMEIRAIADLDEGRLRAHSSKMDVGYTTTSYRDVLADSEVDIVVIGTKQEQHASLIVQSLDAGKWVLCEKPMAETKEQAEAVLAAEERNPGRLAIGFNRRFAPAYSEMKRIAKKMPRPWYINYRLMYPLPRKAGEEDFYSTHERILYEGSHILDLLCWLMEAAPTRVFMSGNPYFNSCSILEFEDGSHVSFMCGSLGTYCFWKEYIEVFGTHRAIAISDFTDMRVRGFRGECDRIFPPHLGEHAEEILKYGFDFYETYAVQSFQRKRDLLEGEFGAELVDVRRPTDLPFDVKDYGPENPDLWGFIPDKGWVQSLEHFAQSFLDGTEPQNADGKAGELTTSLALALISSRERGVPVEFGRDMLKLKDYGPSQSLYISQGA